MVALIFGLFGLIVGSFLNVVILRHGKKGIGGRSECMSCKRTLSWYDMIPVFSWLALGGKCRTCKARVSIQYPLVEALAGIIFSCIGAVYGAGIPVGDLSAMGLLIDYLCIAALLIIIAVYDLYHTIIPDPWVYLLIVLAFVSQVLTILPADFNFELLLLSGPIVALPLFALWFFSRGEWMGFGDVKLALGMGWLLGAMYGIAALFFAFVLGAVIGVGLIAFTHTSKSSKRTAGFTMKSEIPFGPFLVVSTFIVWLLLIHSIDPLALVGLLPL